MKKITLRIILLISLTGYSQQQIYNLGFEPGTNDGTLTTWTTFENPSPGFEIITNPDPDGTNTSATTKVLKLSLAQGAECYSGVINFHGTLGTWDLDGAVTSNLSLSMDVNRSIVDGNIGIKFANTTDGTLFEIKDSQGAVAAANTWETLTWDISEGAASGNNVNIDQIVVFIDWRCSGEPARPSDIELLIDNITWGANKLTDPPVPSCSDGVQNGDETGIDCGGSTCAPCISDPTVSAPSPTIIEDNVMSVYSDAYATNVVSNFNFNAFQGAGTISQEDIESDGNSTGKIENLTFYGAQWDALDISSYTYVHLDYYATTSSAFNFYLIDATAGIPGGNSEEPRFAFATSGGDETFVQGQWNSVFIPLQHFLDYSTPSFTYDLNDIFQWKFDGNGTVYFDNIYFSTEAILGINDVAINGYKVFPNPANNQLTIIADESIENIQVYNLLGQQLINKNSVNNRATINISKLNQGIYVVRTTVDGAIGTKRFIKQ